MKKGNKTTIISVFLVFLFFLGGFAGLVTYSGHDPPFSVIVSQSMQQDENQSKLGSIDTGDMVFVIDKNKVEIRTYIEGYLSGFKTFGDYGSVIIYNTPCKSKIIHRVLMRIEVGMENGEKYARIPELDDYSSFYLMEDDEKQKIKKDFYFQKENDENEI